MTQPAYHDRVLSFAELANRFSKKNLDSLSREEVIEICNKAISDANISAVFENAFAMDCETLNQLQRASMEKIFIWHRDRNIFPTRMVLVNGM